MNKFLLCKYFFNILFIHATVCTLWTQGGQRNSTNNIKNRKCSSVALRDAPFLINVK